MVCRQEVIWKKELWCLNDKNRVGVKQIAEKIHFSRSNFDEQRTGQKEKNACLVLKGLAKIQFIVFEKVKIVFRDATYMQMSDLF